MVYRGVREMRAGTHLGIGNTMCMRDCEGVVMHESVWRSTLLREDLKVRW